MCIAQLKMNYVCDKHSTGRWVLHRTHVSNVLICLLIDQIELINKFQNVPVPYPQCSIQSRNMHISVLNRALWDMEQVNYGICEIGLFSNPARHILPLITTWRLDCSIVIRVWPLSAVLRWPVKLFGPRNKLPLKGKHIGTGTVHHAFGL